MSGSDLIQLREQVADHERRLAALEGVAPVIHSSEGEVALKPLDFSVNPRAFFKHYSANLSGPKKFALAVAYLSKGNTEQAVSLEAIITLWSSVEGVMDGAYKSMYATRAKESDWIESARSGTYLLRPKWMQILPNE